METVKRTRRRWRTIALAILGALSLAALAIGPLHFPLSGYDRRNGAAEAMDDYTAGLPLTIYVHAHNNIGPGSREPGLDCPGTSNVPAYWKIRRVRIAEAGWSEGPGLTGLALRRAEAARAWAYSYNITMFRLHENELRKACPLIRPLPYYPVPTLQAVALKQ
jgi:hypothetical protein